MNSYSPQGRRYVLKSLSVGARLASSELPIDRCHAVLSADSAPALPVHQISSTSRELARHGVRGPCAMARITTGLPYST